MTQDPTRRIRRMEWPGPRDCLGAALALVFTVLLSGCPLVEPDPDPQQACIDSGGTASTALCCLSASDYPDTCLVGACGCAPDSSQEVTVCDCGAGRCFNGTACVTEP